VPGKVIDITGVRFGKLIALSIVGKDSRNNYKWEFICDCGNTKVSTVNQVRRGSVKSCGNHSTEYVSRKHGMRKTRFYGIWTNMKQRSTNQSHRDWYKYGGRGIDLHADWMDFESFKSDMYDSYLEHVAKHGEDNTSIDRVNNDVGYSRSNCRWATRSEQERNKRDVVRSSSGVKGVSWHGKAGKWRAHIKRNGKFKHLGLFESIEDAAEARGEAEKSILREETK
jgi:hypothetical protein